MKTSRIPLLIDTDPGVDDALALLMAFNDPQHEVVGLTIAAGNVGLAHTVANALKLCEVCEVSVPVFAGADAPLVFPARDAAYVHGRDGFGDTGYTPATRHAEAEHAALAILRLSHEYAGTLVLVALAPLTNVALALKLDPSLPSRIARCVVMGAAVSAHGNITAAAEFNIAFDPEALAGDGRAACALLQQYFCAHPGVVESRARRTLACRRCLGDGVGAATCGRTGAARAAVGGGNRWPARTRGHDCRLEPANRRAGQCGHLDAL